jgi:hypothetical protein
MEAASLITMESAGYFSLFFEIGTECMAVWMQTYHTYEMRVRIMSLNRGIRAWFLKYCRPLCNEMDFGKVLRQRLYSHPLTVRISHPLAIEHHETCYFPARDFIMHFVALHSPSSVVNTPLPYQFGSNFINSGYALIETVLHPTTDYPFMDDVRAVHGLFSKCIPPVFFKFELQHTSTRSRGFVTRTDITDTSSAPAKTPASTQRGTCIIDNPQHHEAFRIMNDMITESEQREPILVCLNTPLSHLLALQGMSWMTYVGKMRRARKDADVDSQFARDPSLAIHGIFAFTGCIVITNNKTQRTQRMFMMDYIMRPPHQVVHRVA